MCCGRVLSTLVKTSNKFVQLCKEEESSYRSKETWVMVCNVIWCLCIAIFIINIFICGSYLRAATISANSRSLRRLFVGGLLFKVRRLFEENMVIIINLVLKNQF